MLVRNLGPQVEEVEGEVVEVLYREEGRRGSGEGYWNYLGYFGY